MSHVSIQQNKMNSSRMSITKTKTPFLYACKYDHIDVVRTLLAYPVIDPAEGNSTALFIAVEQNSSKLLKLLLADGRADPMVAGGALIGKALATGNHIIVDSLLKDPRVLIPNDISLLVTAIICKYDRDYGFLENLLAHIDPTANDNIALFTAIGHHHEDALSLLLADPRINPAHNDNAALRYAIEVCNDDALHMMLKDPRVVPSADDNALIKIATLHMSVQHWSNLLCDDRRRCMGRLLLEPCVVAGDLPLNKMGGIEAVRKMQAEAYRWFSDTYDWTTPMPVIVERDA